MTLEIEYVALDALRPAERNARTHSDEQIDQLVGSIQEFGWTNPILVDEDGVIIAGHGRYAAAQRLALDQVPVIRLHGLTAAQKRALALADNKLALNAGWDEELLRLELSELLSCEEIESAVIGFSEAELKRILDASEPDTQPQLDGLTYSVVVECSGEREQAALIERLEGEGYSCRPLIS